MLSIDPGHRDAGSPLLERLAAVFDALDVDVTIALDAGNLIRRRQPGDHGQRAWQVEAEGLPNLLHEYLHMVQAGGPAEDHGIDYRLIPFDTAVSSTRLLLWQEFACCVVSCAYLADRPSAVQPWFDEQQGILHHFYGFAAADPFFDHVDQLLARFPAELATVLASSYERAGADLGPPPARLDFEPLWCALRGAGPIFGT